MTPATKATVAMTTKIRISVKTTEKTKQINKKQKNKTKQNKTNSNSNINGNNRATQVTIKTETISSRKH